MTRILLVKTSSLGDVVHNLPVVRDIRRALPEAAIDWVVESSFAAIPRMHPGVAGVIPVAVRRWRKSIGRPSVWSEIREAIGAIRYERYDAVIDTQGLAKSACLAALARGPRFGLDWRSSREPLALFYDRTFAIPWGLHAVERNRLLAARALGYAPDPEIEFGIRAEPVRCEWLDDAPYAVLLHATSSRAKLWPEDHWDALAAQLAERGWWCLLPWGDFEEKARAERLAERMTHAVVPPALDLRQLAGLLAKARAVVGVDTGLTHLAAALGAPTVGVYRATDPQATGVYGCARARNVGGVGVLPAPAAVLAALAEVAA